MGPQSRDIKNNVCGGGAAPRLADKSRFKVLKQSRKVGQNDKGSGQQTNPDRTAQGSLNQK